MQTCDLKQDCMTWPHEPNAMCYREVHNVVNKCYLRKPMPCGHPRLFGYVSASHEGYLGGPPLAYLMCRKCEQEASNEQNQ